MAQLEHQRPTAWYLGSVDLSGEGCRVGNVVSTERTRATGPAVASRGCNAEGSLAGAF